MKKLSMLLFLVLTFCFSTLLFAAEGDVGQAPEWLSAVLGMLQSIPKVGPVLVIVLKWAGGIAAITTALSACVIVVIKVLKTLSGAAGLDKALEGLAWFEEKVLPKIQWFSMYNVQKK